MFGLVLTSAVTFMHVYVLWRAASVPFLRQRMGRKRLVAAGLVLWLLFLFGRVCGHDNEGILASTFELAGMTWMGILLLTSVTLFAVDIVTCFGLLFRRSVPTLRTAALISGLALSLIATVQAMRAPIVTSYDVELPGLPASLDGTVIIGLSDLHLGATLGITWLEERVAQVTAERPDMIVLLGDIFEGHGRPPQGLVTGLRNLKAPMGVWAVLGNHEFHGSDSSIVPLFREAGITVLRNEKTSVRRGLVLAGVDDLTYNRRAGAQGDVVRKTLAAPTRDATILLSHTPWNTGRAAMAGAGLMLCGHTHGGQLWPFGHLVRFVYPLLHGRYDVGGMTVIVSRGAGTWGPRMRLWQPGEILRITLRGTKRQA